MSHDDPCRFVDEEIAALIEDEGPPEAHLEAHLDHCDRCALTVARVQRLAAGLGSLGEGFVVPSDLTERVLSVATRRDDGAGERRAPLRRLLSIWNTLPGRLALLGSGLAVAILAVVAAPDRAAPPSPASGRSMRAVVQHRGGAEVRRAGRWVAVADGDRLDLRHPLRVVTGRARITLPEQGVTLALNLETMVQAGPRPGSLRLLRGDLVADVTRRADGEPFIVLLPTGRVDVLGTKLHVSAGKNLALVDVVHGTVRVTAADGGSTVVSAGQEAAVTRAGRPVVSMAPDLGRVLSWSLPDGPTAEPVPAGLGSLEARRPGRSGRKIPLRLEEHAVKVRVQGGLARTEITETFENPTHHTLEGIYRFPLPSGARISRLALYVDGRLEEGTVVERDRAVKIWRGVIRQATPTRLRKKKEEYIWVPGPWRDPALLQWREGNQFELRIFPIPPRGSRKVILAYTESLPRTARGRRYVYPLPRPGKRDLRAGRFDLDLRLGGHDPLAPIRISPQYQARVFRDGSRVSFSAEPFDPRGDLVVDFATPAARSPLLVRTYQPADGDAGYVLLSLKAQLPSYRSDRPRDLVLLVDRSHSTTGEAGRRALMLARAMVEEMDGRDRLAVAACDSSCRTLGAWVAPSAREAGRVVRALGAVKPGGATDLGEAMRHAGQLLAGRAGAARARRARVVYLGDGVPTVGELRPAHLAAQVRRHLRPHRARLTTVGVGSSADATALAAMARAAGGDHVAYGPGMTVKGQALKVLARQYGVTLEQVRVKLPAGLTRVAPALPAVLHQGEELVLVGRATGRVQGPVILSGRVNGEPFSVSHDVSATIRPSEGNAFLPRLWAQLTVDRLQAEGSGEQHRGTIVSLSKRHYLLTRYTSLLVLESEAMRRAFGVEQGRRAHEWTGEAGAEESEPDAEGDGDGHRSAEERARRSGVLGVLGSSGRGRGQRDALDDLVDSAVAPRGGDATGVGGLGFHGHGRGGGGRRKSGKTSSGAGEGYGRGPGRLSPGNRVPDHIPGRVTRGRPQVMGALDKEVIRRVIRRHINEVRFVYQRALQSNPNLAGRVMVRFTIGPNGQVISASASGTASPEVQRGIASVVRRWRFPRPAGGGIVTVSYPFVLRSAGGGGERSTRTRVDRAIDGLLGARVPPPPPRADGRRWVRMRRVHYQEATLGSVGSTAHDLRLAEARRKELEEMPDSRDRHLALYRALSRAGRPAEALSVLEAWLARDPRSAQALSLLSETAARLGQRQRALRALGSLVELDHRNASLQTRLAAMQDALGSTRAACAHWISLADISGADAEAARRARDCRDGYRPSPRRQAPSGSVVLRGRWPLGGVDLDLALVTPRGRRIAWLGDRGRLRFEHVTSSEREVLAVRWLPPGRYRLEVSRADAADSTPVKGALVVRAPGLSRRLQFRLPADEQRRYVAELAIHRRTRLEPAPW
jgi:TonB family protein